MAKSRDLLPQEQPMIFGWLISIAADAQKALLLNGSTRASSGSIGSVR